MCDSTNKCPSERKCPTALKAIPKVDIDISGVFKYILIKVHGAPVNNEEPSVTIVRGYKRCEYHTDIYNEVQRKLEPFKNEPIGGGKISHEPENKKIHIYGKSQGYGKADHEITAQLVRDVYSDYTVSIGDDE